MSMQINQKHTLEIKKCGILEKKERMAGTIPSNSKKMENGSEGVKEIHTVCRDTCYRTVYYQITPVIKSSHPLPSCKSFINKLISSRTIGVIQ